MLFFSFFIMMGATVETGFGGESPRDKPSRHPRMFDYFFGASSSGNVGPLSRFIENKQRQSTLDMLNALKKECRKLGGKLVNGECYEFIKSPKDFTDARDFCQARGGDMWTPNLDDTFFFEKLMHYFPGASISEEGYIFLGVEPGTDRDIFGNDLSSTLLVRAIGVICSDCYTYDINRYKIDCRNCDAQTFLCEYPISLESVPKQNVFDKLASFIG